MWAIFQLRAAFEAIPIDLEEAAMVDGATRAQAFVRVVLPAARPAIAVARPGQGESAAINLDGFFGLNPRLAGLKPLWDQRTLAVVHACGSPDATRSHFDAQDYMESGTPGVKSTQDGWINRYLHDHEHANASPFRAVALTGQMPRSLQGAAPALAMAQVGQFALGNAYGKREDLRDTFFMLVAHLLF